MGLRKETTPVNRDLNREYYSGAQASIFIGDIWVDDIVEYSFSNSYSAKPVFGYGSTWFDHVAEGRELIQGSFTINFREPNYLWIILSAYKGKYNIQKAKPGNQADSSEFYDTANQNALMQQKRQDLDSFFRSGDGAAAAEKLRNKKNLGNTVLSKEYSDFAYPPFDIVIGYGHKLDKHSPGERIVDCKIVGKGRSIVSDGQPIKETYQFFGKKQE